MRKAVNAVELLDQAARPVDGGLRITAQDAQQAFERALETGRAQSWNDPATGVMRHADAGYEIAVEASKRHGLNLPMVK